MLVKRANGVQPPHRPYGWQSPKEAVLGCSFSAWI